VIVEFDDLVDGAIFESLGLRFMLVGRSGGVAYLATNPNGIDDQQPPIVCRVSVDSIKKHEINELNSWDDSEEDECCDHCECDVDCNRLDLRTLVGKILLDVNDGSQYLVLAYKETESLGPVVFLIGEGWKTLDQIEEDYAVGVEAECCQAN